MAYRLNLFLLPPLLFFFFLLGLTFSAIAQQKHTSVNIVRLTVEDGLSQGTVYSMAQDSKGFIWIATFNGLDHYDGNEFMHFRHESNDPYSISSNEVRVILEDSHQRLWVSTNDNGLNYFDPVARRFYHFFPGKQIINMVEDAKGNLYVNMNDTLVYLQVKSKAEERLIVNITFFSYPILPFQALRLTAGYTLMITKTFF